MKPKWETISNNRLLQALTFRGTCIYRYNPLDRNINCTTNLVHRTTVHMWRWFNSNDSSVLCCGRVAELQVTKKPYPSFSVNLQTFALQCRDSASLFYQWVLCTGKNKYFRSGDRRATVGRLSGDCRVTPLVKLSAVSRPTVGRQSPDCRPSVAR